MCPKLLFLPFASPLCNCLSAAYIFGIVVIFYYLYDKFKYMIQQLARPIKNRLFLSCIVLLMILLSLPPTEVAARDLQQIAVENYAVKEPEALALLKSDHSFRSYIEGATAQVAAERMVEFIGKKVELTPTREQKLVRALCRYVKSHPAEHTASEWSALCAMIYSKVAEGDYYMILKGRIVDSVIAKHLTKEEFGRFREQYIPYFKSMIVALRSLEGDYNRYNCAIHTDIIVTEYGFPKIDNIIWYLSQTNQICISDALANDNKHPSKFLGIDILHF